LPSDVDWEDTAVELPGIEVQLENRLTKQKFEAEKALNVNELFVAVPFGVLRNS
jgi:maltooligosyltrehalose synthase